MFKYLEKLRQESEAHRRSTAIVVSFCLTGVIALAWLMLVTSDTSIYVSEKPKTDSPSPLGAIGDSINESVGALKDAISALGSLKDSAVIFEASSTTVSSTTESSI